MTTQQIPDSLYWLIVLSVVTLDVIMFSLATYIASLRAPKCSWTPADTDRKYILGAIITLLGIFLSFHSLPQLTTLTNGLQSKPPAVVILGAVGGAIGGTIVDPRKWAGWFGYYWVVLAIKHKRQPATPGFNVGRILLATALGLIVAGWVVLVPICKTDLQQISHYQPLHETTPVVLNSTRTTPPLTTASTTVPPDTTLSHASPRPTPAAAAPLHTMQEEKIAVAKGMIATIKEIREQHKTASAPYSKEIVSIYSPSSFSSREEVLRFMAAVKAFDEAERQYNQALHELRKQIEDLVNASQLDAAHRKEFLRTFDQNYGPSLAVMDEYQAAEDLWARDTMQLYGVAYSHFGDIRTTQDQISIADEEFRNWFNSQVSKSRNSFDKMRAADKKIATVHKLSLEEFGLTQADLDKAVP
jgi:hypothetical protein